MLSFKYDYDSTNIHIINKHAPIIYVLINHQRNFRRIPKIPLLVFTWQSAVQAQRLYHHGKEVLIDRVIITLPLNVLAILRMSIV